MLSRNYDSSASGTTQTSHIIVFLSINTTHAAIFLCHTIESMQHYHFHLSKFVRTVNMFGSSMYWQLTHWRTLSRRVGAHFMNRMLQRKSERERGEERRGENERWIEYVRNEAILRLVLEKFLSTKEFDSEQTLWMKKNLFYWKLKWITSLANYPNNCEYKNSDESRKFLQKNRSPKNCIYCEWFESRVYNTVKQEAIKSSCDFFLYGAERIGEKKKKCGTVFWYRWQTIVVDIVPRIIILCNLFSTWDGISSLKKIDSSSCIHA